MAAMRPRDVKLLKEIVRRHCEMNGIMTQEGIESVAASAVRFYERGIIETRGRAQDRAKVQIRGFALRCRCSQALRPNRTSR